MFEDKAARRALVVQPALRECGFSTALACIEVMSARDWPAFRAAISTVVYGSSDLCADVAGNIGWRAGGKSSKRVGYDGLMPVPAGGGHDWDGYLGIDELPSRYNPPEGWIAGAKEMSFPSGWRADRVTSHGWVAVDLCRRIVQVLTPAERFGATQSLDLQQDTLSTYAGALLPRLEGMASDRHDREPSTLVCVGRACRCR